MTTFATQASPVSRDKLRRLALAIRMMFRKDNEPLLDIVKFIEVTLASHPDLSVELIPVEDGYLHNCYAKAVPTERIIYVRESVYTGACRGIARDRFTITHELAHTFLHRESSISLARVDVGSSIPRYRDPEWQANTFAAELLVPFHLMQDKSIDEIVQSCNVSWSVAQIQASYMKQK